MTSLLSTFLRGGGPMPPDTLRRSSTGSVGLPATPSFNDFSMFSQQDAESEYSTSYGRPRSNLGNHRHAGSETSSSYESRNSMEYITPEARDRLWNGRPPLGPGASSKAMSIPHSRFATFVQQHQASAAATAPSAATRPRRKEGKIDGLGYYEFCELIRSSSL